MNPATTLIDFVKHERDWVSAHLVSCELEKLGRLAPSDWPVATVEQWREAIDGAVAAGQLEEDGRGNVRFRPKEVRKPKEEGWLF